MSSVRLGQGRTLSHAMPSSRELSRLVGRRSLQKIVGDEQKMDQLLVDIFPGLA